MGRPPHGLPVQQRQQAEAEQKERQQKPRPHRAASFRVFFWSILPHHAGAGKFSLPFFYFLYIMVRHAQQTVFLSERRFFSI